MAKGLANNYRVWIESTTPGTYNLIRGQQGATINRSSSPIDTSTKDDAGYGTSAPGLRALSVSMTMIPNLPDANGYTRLETLANSGNQPPFNIQVRKGGDTGGTSDVIFACSVYGSLDSTSFDQNAPVVVSVNFPAAAAPTIDTLAV